MLYVHIVAVPATIKRKKRCKPSQLKPTIGVSKTLEKVILVQAIFLVTQII